MMFNEYPYINLTDLNLDWLMKLVKEVNEKLSQYLENSVITFADPIEWNITAQYTALTCVVDSDGTAYLSKQPVPTGVDISNTNYWMPIFNYNDSINELRGNIAYNERTSAAATVLHPQGSLFWVNGTLYEALTDIQPGDGFVLDSNMKISTVNDKIVNTAEDLQTLLQNLDRRLTNSVNDLTAADSLIRGNIAYNEGNRGTASKPFNKNDLVWLNDNLYFVQYNIPAGTAYIEGENVTRTTVDTVINSLRVLIGSNTVQIDALRTDTEEEFRTVRSEISTAVGSVSDTIDSTGKKLSDRDFLFIGDSYGDEVGEWPYRVKTMLGLTDDNCHILCEGGSGFISNGQLLFINQLISYAGDRTKVSDIIICGGLNDSFSTDIQAQWWSDLRVNMNAVNDYIKNNYPNATTWIGYIGNGLDGAEALGARMYTARRLCEYYYYQYAMDFNWRVLHGVEIALTSSRYNIATDGVHPSAFGSLALSQAIAQSLLTNNVTIAYPATVGASIKSPYTGQMGLTYTQENYDTVLHIRSNYIRVSASTVLQPQIVIGDLTNLYFNKQFDCNVTVRLDAFNNLPYIFLPARLSFNRSNMMIELFEADTAGTYISQYTAGSNAFIRIMDCDIVTKSIYLA